MTIIDIERLTTFLKVAQYGSFQQVAEQSFLSQRAVSKQIKQLENDLGVTLFVRGKNKITLTPQGKMFLSSAQDIVNNYMSALSELKRFDQNNQNVLRIGYFSAFEKKLLEDASFKLLQKMPELNLIIREESNEHLVQSLDNGNLDLALSIDYGISPVPVGSELKSVPIFQGQMLMGISTLNPLSTNEEIHPGDLKDYPILYYSPESSTFLLESFLATIPEVQDFERIQRVSSVEQMHLLVALNQAVAFYPGGLLSNRRVSADGHIKYLQIMSKHSQAYTIVALYNPKHDNPLLKSLLQSF
ncbi:MAG: LysR family transcriptional regulator [Lentilactobacillus diolivorans]